MSVGIAVVGTNHSLHRLAIQNVLPRIADLKSPRKALGKLVRDIPIQPAS